jgi:hypothetical protein
MIKDISNDPRAAELVKVLGEWLKQHPNWNQTWDDANAWWRQRTASEIAEDLVDPIEEMDVELAGVLESPDGRLIQVVAGWLLPGWPAALVQLLSDSVLLAAQARNRDQKISAGLYATASVLIAAALILMLGQAFGGNSRS